MKAPRIDLSPAPEVSTSLEMVAGGFAKVPEAQQYLGICRAKLYSLMDAGDLAYAKIGKSRRIPWTALRAYAASCVVGD